VAQVINPNPHHHKEHPVPEYLSFAHVSAANVLNWTGKCSFWLQVFLEKIEQLTSVPRPTIVQESFARFCPSMEAPVEGASSPVAKGVARGG
jgi:hypothetical protein